MAISYDHLQVAKNSFMTLTGVSMDELAKYSTYTDNELYRSYINPGFDATIRWIEYVIRFAGSAAGATTVSGKLQIRARGESSWVDMATFTAPINTPVSVFELSGWFEAGATSDSAPWEIRIIASNSNPVDTYFHFGQGYYNCHQSGSSAGATTNVGLSATTRTVGDSV